MSTSETRTPAPAAAPERSEAAESADRMAYGAVFISGFRCVMMYMVLPAAGPVISQFDGVILPINVLMHVLTLVTTTLAVRRARRSDHPWRRAYMGMGVFFFVFSLLTMAVELIIYLSPPVAP